MKVAKKVSKVIKSEDFEIIEFQVKAGAKLFDMTIGKLYSDIPKAIVRELSANAYDAHKEAGCEDIPFYVHLPSVYEPYFEIRDYGTGISPEDIRRVYTVLMESTKDDSNDYTGCLGLGSKTPFAYGDSFTVESFYEGKKYCYLAHRNEERIPCLAETVGNGTDTTERNGLRIKLSVKRTDFSYFQRAAEQIYPYFNTVPTFGGDVKLDIQKPEVLIEGDGWRVYKCNGQSSYNVRSSQAIMGNIVYKIDSNQWNYADAVRDMLNCGVGIDFPIGELEFVSSREELKYTPQTKAIIEKRCEKVLEEIADSFKETLKDCKTLWSARCCVLAMADTISHNIYLRFAGNLEWKGVKNLNESFISIDDKDVEHMHIHLSSYRVTCTIDRGRDIRVSDQTKFIINDLKAGAQSRCSHAAKGNGGSYLLCKFKTNKAKKDFITKLGITDSSFVLASTLDKPQARMRATTGGLSRVAKFVDSPATTYNSTSKAKVYWEDSKVDLSVGGYYFEFNRYNIVMRERISPPELLREVRCMEGIEIPKDTYGIKTADIKKANNSGKWINVLDYFKEEFEKLCKKFDYQQSIADVEAKGKFHSVERRKLFKGTGELDSVKDTLFGRTYAKYEQLKGVDVRKAGMYKGFYLFLYGEEPKKKTASVLVNGDVDKLLVKYPLINLIDFNTYGSDNRYSDEVAEEFSLYVLSKESQV